MIICLHPGIFKRRRRWIKFGIIRLLFFDPDIQLPVAEVPHLIVGCEGVGESYAAADTTTRVDREPARVECIGLTSRLSLVCRIIPDGNWPFACSLSDPKVHLARAIGKNLVRAYKRLW